MFEFACRKDEVSVDEVDILSGIAGPTVGMKFHPWKKFRDRIDLVAYSFLSPILIGMCQPQPAK